MRRRVRISHKGVAAAMGILAIAAFIAVPHAARAAEEERILSFSSDIRIAQDSSFTVTEEIVYDFGENERHGIYRDIPVSYRTALEHFSVRLTVLSVQDERGTTYRYTTSNDAGMFSIKIGDPDAFVSGIHTYHIRYRIERALLFHEDESVELYWNVTGTNWNIPMEEVAAEVTLPSLQTPASVRAVCFVGTAGSAEENCSLEIDESGTKVRFAVPQGLNSGEGLTIAVRWPQGSMNAPAVWLQLWWLVSDNLILALPLLYLFGYGTYWWRNGRDPRGRGTIVAQYEPPDNLTPSEIGVIIDQSADKQDLGAAVVYLAEQGFLKIRLIEKARFLGLGKKKEWEFARVSRLPRELDTVEREIIKALKLEHERATPVRLSELKNGVFAKHIGDIHNALYAQVTDKGYMPHHPVVVRVAAIALGLAALVAVWVLTIVLGGALTGMWQGAMGSSAVIAVLFGWVMPKRTLKGRLALEHALGFKQYLAVAEKDRIKFHNPVPEQARYGAGSVPEQARYGAGSVPEQARYGAGPPPNARRGSPSAGGGPPTRTPELFEKWLPYAMVLRVEDEWAKQFKDMLIPAPSWYEGGVGTWSSIAFANSMSNAGSDMASAFSSQPPSSSGGGFGGGGGVGGGFGGGGGGSW